MMRLAYILAVLTVLAGLGTPLSTQACQFDPPGMSHEAWLKWVEERNQKNAELAQGKQTKVAQKGAEVEKKASRTIAPIGGPRYQRRTAGDNAVIRIRQ